MPQRQNNNIDLRSEHVQELLEAVPNWMIRYGNMLILIFIIMFFTLSWFIKYPDIISTEAEITSKLPPQKKYAQVSGRLDSILIKNNASIKENEIIAILENTANFEHIKLLKSIIDSTKINTKNFNFPLEELPVLFLGEIDTEYALFENNYIQYQLNKEYNPYENEQQGNKYSKIQLKSRLNTLLSQKEINKVELEFQKKDFERQEHLFEKGVISKQTLESKELSYLQAKRNFANIDASISQIKEAITNTNTSEVSTSIQKRKDEISMLKNVIQSFNQLKRAIRDWEMKYALISNINGKVAFSKLWTKNQSVNQGDLLFTIIPAQNSSYIAKLKTPAQNSGKIKEGQTVNIKLENYPDNEFGLLKGTVESISLLTNEDGFYNVVVALPSKLITSYNREIPFKFEMRGSAEIITEDLRLIERFFYQLKNVFDT
ncbi:HlyD family efflux transporter periplasmic adaptor subunit [Winogradskyella sp. SYSU M77433]|uniref:HlyD family secretion protein n=1 Tax=Winogradskyella sp. SYSU M77433 TaxID=3042722 RepID=UPI00248003F4|nr:HlyD family efflux transporter periplasmic adaptor subunit [Winogradskyella sp. SYSU M77433]MDH7914578.1 HlyD family efflux transporter periplasmic adaptor subunit [Winogradskyella sp. SYSU M77433]